ncbi:DUF2130 domain-containing protein [Phenylobacterium soli]|uniref:DUF2130 domain-containing protein n=1 Tax=Phenylobacterium soli TaxID=2170551 RepID=A0A328AJF2_9CAUL|nr:DUF2130 domain-containing protein [Phenylobacterium soli]RAK53544.1 DUF2130 domain-containing protein [Phenylobacterium soli]
MSEPTITCPNCKHEIKLTESLAAPLIAATRQEFQAQLVKKDEEVAARESALEKEREALAQQRAEVEELVGAKVEEARAKIAEQEARKARALIETDLQEKDRSIADLQTVLQQREAKLAEAQQVQADLLKKQRALDDEKRELDLTIEKRVQEMLGSVRDKAKLEAEQALQLKVREKEETIASMQRQIEDLKRKAEQGSQQLQGEVQELELESLLRSKFPHDDIDAVPKGEFGGDLIQRVRGPGGQVCGSILWEIKRTKNWSDGWLTKVRGDQRAANADVSLIISHALPKDMLTNFDLVDGVWVAEPKCAVPVALALRESIIALAAARQASEGQQTKTEMIYAYLTGSRFRHRVEAIVERFTEMQADLQKERTTMTRLWAKREEQIRAVIESTAGMYGDLQGIAGKSLKEIAALDVLLLESPE